LAFTEDLFLDLALVLDFELEVLVEVLLGVPQRIDGVEGAELAAVMLYQIFNTQRCTCSEDFHWNKGFKCHHTFILHIIKCKGTVWQ